MTQPGDLDQTVTVEAWARVPDGHGGAVEQWAEAGTIRAHVEPVASQTAVVADRERNVTGYRLTVRNMALGARLAPDTHRLRWQGTPFAIRHAPAVPRALYRTIEVETETG